MVQNGDHVLYRSGEILYECRSGLVWCWRTLGDRAFVWEGGVLSIWNGKFFVPLSRQPDWQAGIQFSCGFDAGRDLPEVGTEVS